MFVDKFNNIKTIDFKPIKQIYIKSLDTSLPQSLYISCCYFSGLLETLTDIQKTNPNAYIICIGYTCNDFQIACTGTGKFKESYSDTVIREIFEEIDIDVDSNNIKLCSINKSNLNKISYVYKINSSQCISSTNSRTNIITDKKNDNKKHKFTIIIYGTLEDTIRIISSSRINHDNTDDIGFYASIHINDAILICQKIISDNKVNSFTPYKCIDNYLYIGGTISA